MGFCFTLRVTEDSSCLLLLLLTRTGWLLAKDSPNSAGASQANVAVLMDRGEVPGIRMQSRKRVLTQEVCWAPHLRGC